MHDVDIVVDRLIGRSDPSTATFFKVPVNNFFEERSRVASRRETCLCVGHVRLTETV